MSRNDFNAGCFSRSIHDNPHPKYALTIATTLREREINPSGVYLISLWLRKQVQVFCFAEQAHSGGRRGPTGGCRNTGNYDIRMVEEAQRKETIPWQSLAVKAHLGKLHLPGERDDVVVCGLIERAYIQDL